MSTFFGAIFLAVVAFLFYIRMQKISFSEGLSELKHFATSVVKPLKPLMFRVLPMLRSMGQWVLGHKVFVSVIAGMIIVPTGAYAVQQSLLNNSKPDQFLASFAHDVDAGSLSVLDNISYFADANSAIKVLPDEYLPAFEKSKISNSIEINRADSTGSLSFRINHRGPYKLKSYDVFEFPLFVRKWKIVDLYAANMTWSLSGSDPQQVLTLGDKTLSVGDLSNKASGLDRFRILPFGTFRYSLSAFGFNKGIDNRPVKLVSGPIKLALEAKSELPQDVIDSAVDKARAVITACMNRQASGKSDCDLLTWNHEDSRNVSDVPYGDFKDEKIVGITWKIKSCAANFFHTDTLLTGTQTISCDGFREVKTKYVENSCYEKLVFGVYLYGCWGLQSSYGTSSEWFTASLELPVVLKPENNEITVSLPKN